MPRVAALMLVLSGLSCPDGSVSLPDIAGPGGAETEGAAGGPDATDPVHADTSWPAPDLDAQDATVAPADGWTSAPDAKPAGPDVPPSGKGPTDPGRVTIHRLNRAEYNNTVRDLLLTKLRPADAFPPDDVSEGFDNLSDVLTTSTVHVEHYYAAAEALAKEALGAPGPAKSAILICDPAAIGEAPCASAVLAGFARRAWRRPVTPAEVDGLATLFTLARGQGDAFAAAIGVAMTAVLTSPYFLFRPELDPAPASLAAHPLDDHALASRLSYFLWSSMPDAELSSLADAGQLTDDAVLAAQVERMLDDPKRDALVAHFTGQWLRTRALAGHAAEATTFPTWSTLLADSMREEVERAFSHLLSTDAPVSGWLQAKTTFVDDRLAKHYGLPSPGAGWSEVSLAGSARTGVLTLGGPLTVTSPSTRTSPTARGSFVLERLMCFPPIVPPGDVNTNLQPGSGSIRDKLAQHTTDETCAGCHEVLDPIGFGLEHFDAIGKYRTDDPPWGKVDATGVHPMLGSFDGASELTAAIAAQGAFGRCLAEKLFTYALGRSPHLPDDTLWLDGIDAEAASAGGGLRAIIAAIVMSRPFRERRGEVE